MAEDNCKPVRGQTPAEFDSTKQEDVEVKGDEVLPDDFFWDSIVQYLASGMIALTLLGQAAVALVEVTSGTVKCFTGNENFTREQNAYVNDFCDRYAPVTQYLSWFLVLQAISVVVPHFLWKSWYKGKFRFFFELAKSLDRHRNSKSGQYDLKNFKIMRSLREEFGKSKPIPWMFITYVLKLILQLFFVITAFPIHAGVFPFESYHPSFFCPPVAEGQVPCTKLQSDTSCNYISTSDSDWPFDFHMHCVLANLSTQSVVWVLNIVVLILSSLALIFALIWCFHRHTQFLNWKQAALFSFESSLNANHFVAKRFWDTLRRPKLYRISTDFAFLFMKLQRFDAGLAKVLRELVIDDLVKWMIIKNNEEQNSGALKETDNKNTTQNDTNSQFGMKMGTFIQRFIWYTQTLAHSSDMHVLDLSFGSPAGFAYPLAERAFRVVSFTFDHHYENPDQPVKRYEFLNSRISRLKGQGSLFGLPTQQAMKFNEAFVPLYIHRLQSGAMAYYNINVVVIGPLTTADEDRVITIHELLNFLDISSPRLLATGALLVTLKPVAIEGASPKQFIDFTPTKRVWKHVEVDFETEDAIVLKPEGEGGERSSNPIASDVVKLLCGETVCHFQVKKYYYLPEYLTNQDSQQSCHANGLYLRKFSGVDPNWFPW